MSCAIDIKILRDRKIFLVIEQDKQGSTVKKCYLTVLGPSALLTCETAQLNEEGKHV